MNIGKEIGYIGEKYIVELLPDAEWPNKDKEQRLYYDLIWKDIKLGVNTSMRRRLHEDKDSIYFPFRPSSHGINSDIVIRIFIYKTLPFLWVDRFDSFNNICQLSRSVNKFNLAKVILKTFNSYHE